MPTVLFFCDDSGTIVEAHAGKFPEWDMPPGTPIWEALDVITPDMSSFLERFPLGQAHGLTGPAGQPLTLRTLQLPFRLAPRGGFLVTLVLLALTAPLPSATPPTSAATLDYAVFDALFHDAQDAILLTDDAFSILAANRKAQTLYAPKDGALTETNLERILRREDAPRILATARALKSGASWRGPLVTIDAGGLLAPVKLNLRCVSVGEARLYQFMLRDQRKRMALERDLAQSRIQVADMNTTLKQVLRNVEEERQELKDELVQQVREEVLPTVERIVLEDSPLVRQAYRSALEEKIADMVETTQDSASLLGQLTPREMDICRLIQQSWQGRAIAQELGISFETLQTHRKNIRRKLGLKGGPTSLAAFLQQQPPL